VTYNVLFTIASIIRITEKGTLWQNATTAVPHPPDNRNNMPEPIKESPPDLASLNREKARLRLIGILVLAAGLISAGLVYWLGNRAGNARLDQYEEARIRAETRQMQILYGTSGGLTEDLTNALRRPGAQALLIAVVSGMIAAGCFYLGRPFPDNEEANLTEK
jgi:uncharacterized protein YjeT (DUF2065 family)